MDESVRALVWQRAGGRCEYCRLAQDQDPVFTFHVEHIIAKQHGGPDDETNLGLPCYHCNLHKGPNLRVCCGSPGGAAVISQGRQPSPFKVVETSSR